MSEYLTDSAALTATADAIRTKGGTSAQIEWDETQGFKTAVEAIPSGGSSLIGDKKFDSGIVYITSDLSSESYYWHIPHALGKLPSFLFIGALDNMEDKPSLAFWGGMSFRVENAYDGVTLISTNSSGLQRVISIGSYPNGCGATAEYVKIGKYYSTGIKYYWLVIE